MKVPSFASSDYVQIGNQPFEQGQPIFTWRRWMNALWTSHTGLPNAVSASASAKGFIWHKNAVGYATGAHAGNSAQNQAVAADCGIVKEECIMAFTAANLHLQPGAVGDMQYIYDAGSDTLATVIAAGYFNNTDDSINL